LPFKEADLSKAALSKTEETDWSSELTKSFLQEAKGRKTDELLKEGKVLGDETLIMAPFFLSF
jgi:hypothetical protein